MKRSSAAHRKRGSEGDRNLFLFLPPAVLVQEVGKVLPFTPAGLFEDRRARIVVGVAEREQCNRFDVRRDAEDAADVRLFIKGDPAHRDPFRVGGEPHVLDGAGDRQDVRLGDRVAAEDVVTAARRVAGDADGQRGFAQAFDFEGEEMSIAAFLGEMDREGAAFFVGGEGELVFDLLVAHEDEIPRLHEADRRRMVAGEQDALDFFVFQRVRFERADVASVADRFVDGIALFGREVHRV